ncbi:MAG: thioredoxin family protein [Ahrensia sp.]|nr:thioredoxin family protein [Ahrensia sp.]
MPTPIVSREDWLIARMELLKEEKQFMQQRDALSAKRRQMPWLRIDTDYRFDTVDGEKSLAELFCGKSQLIVYHFMFGTDWNEGCKSCSLNADGYDGLSPHLAARDAAFVTVSNAPLDTLLKYRDRMGWSFDWVSSIGPRFGTDFHVTVSQNDRDRGKTRYNYRDIEPFSDEMPGVSVFATDGDGQVYHTYSSYSRGLDNIMAIYHYLDLLPKGRDEEGLAFAMEWVKRHDEYAG